MNRNNPVTASEIGKITPKNRKKNSMLFLARLRAVCSFPSVSRATERARCGKPREARARRKRKKKRFFFLPLPIPSSFLSLICIILTEFRARRISGTKTDYS